ncbi:MAG TPA: lipase family protein [Geobacteraceae bacterium]|nr:lipase family protein [Geobacteraceae bacterium]
MLLDIDNCTAATYGLLVMYAWDMCDGALDPASSAIDPRIAADGWEVTGIITGADDVIVSGPGGIRQARISAGGDNDRKRYGYVARNQNVPDRYIAVIRGTDGAEEWIDDCVFVMTTPGGDFPGGVETGFFDIYKSLRYFPLNAPDKSIPLVQGIEDVVGEKGRILVLGHSLGSALATYLTFALAGSASLGGSRVSAVLFASPKTGNHEFVGAFDGQVGEYIVINYEHDLVPRVPPFDITHLDIYRTLPACRIITDETAKAKVNNDDKACCHHLICYVAMLCPEVYGKAAGAAGWTDDDRKCASCVSA